MSDSTDIRPDAQRLVEQVPATASWDDLAYQMYVQQAIELFVAEADGGRLIDHDMARARVRSRIRRAL